MKKRSLIVCLGVMTVLSSCTTYQYSSRQVDVNLRDIGSEKQMSGVVVDYNRKVSSTSSYQLTKRDAIAEAEYNCLQEQKIDVVVDPITKVEYNPFKVKTKYKATITGFAGMLEQRPAGVEATKEYSLEEIEKYKLLTDPNFAQYYYHQGSGDVYNIGVSGNAPKSVSSPVIMKEPGNLKVNKSVSSLDYSKYMIMRNTGFILMGAGVVTSLAVGLPLYACADSNAGEITGFILQRTGEAMVTAGIPLAIIGSVKMKKANQGNLSFTLNADSNGLGLGLNF